MWFIEILANFGQRGQRISGISDEGPSGELKSSVFFISLNSACVSSSVFEFFFVEYFFLQTFINLNIVFYFIYTFLIRTFILFRI